MTPLVRSLTECPECHADFILAPHLGTCSHSVMQGGGELAQREWGYRYRLGDETTEWIPVAMEREDEARLSRRVR